MRCASAAKQNIYFFYTINFLYFVMSLLDHQGVFNINIKIVFNGDKAMKQQKLKVLRLALVFMLLLFISCSDKKDSKSEGDTPHSDFDESGDTPQDLAPDDDNSSDELGRDQDSIPDDDNSSDEPGRDQDYTPNDDDTLQRTVECTNKKPDSSSWDDANPGGKLVQTFDGESYNPPADSCKWNCDEGFYEDYGRCLAGEFTEPEFGKEVSLEMGPHSFKWTFSKEVEWGYFIDGQPWIVKPESGVSLTLVTPEALTTNMPFNEKTIEATIHQTVINPPVSTKGSTIEYVNTPSFGWDSRVSYKDDWGAYNANLAWDQTPLELSTGDSVVTARSFTNEYKSDDGQGVLEAVAVLTVLEKRPPSDAFRPGPVREGSYRTNPEIIRYSDIIDLSNHMISWPKTPLITNVSSPDDYLPPSTNEWDGGKGEENFTSNRLTKLMPGPFFVNSGDMVYRYTYGSYNNTYDYDNQEPSNQGYRQYIAIALGDLAVGALAKWLPEQTRKVCRIRLIQNGIDTFHSLQSGLILEQDGGHVSGYLTLMTVVGKMLNHKTMLDMNTVVNGERPELALNGVAQNFKLSKADKPEEDNPHLWINYKNKDIEMNMEDFDQILDKSTQNTFKIKRNHQWSIYRPGTGLYNMKIKITDGKGAGSQIYVVTDINDLYYDDGDGPGDKIPKESSDFTHEGHPYGGILTVKSDEGGSGWVGDWPDSTSRMTFSAYTSEDDGEWLFCRKSIMNKYGDSSDYSGVMERITPSPDQSYLDIVTGTELTLLIALYALDVEEIYKGRMDTFLINVSGQPGFGEHLFSGVNARHITGTNNHQKEIAALWKEQVLDKVGVTFYYTGNGMSDLKVPAASAKLWNE